MERVWEKNIDELIVRIIMADLLTREVDAIVNSANSFLVMEKGLAAAIKQAGGEAIEQEALEAAPISVGAAVITGAGDLKARYVVHAAIMGTDGITNEDKVRMAVLNILRRCGEKDIETVAMPVLGTGQGGLSMNISAETMLREISEYCEKRKTPFKLIEIVVNNEEDYRICAAELQKIFT
jgi:O-acetyl-ADP-ribose deacetylase (regulator of RNase III)